MVAVRNDLMQMISRLTEEDYFSAVRYIEFLSQTRQNSAKNTLHKIQSIFADDKGWNSEEEMLKDMAEFRRKRETKCVY
ncbi:MAG: hypothetical protein J6W76_04345 [Spirochaetales bacterium]|nr:hypothetical protein [Spirochaetales bacterium]